jgi:hypothetical protein
MGSWRAGEKPRGCRGGFALEVGGAPRWRDKVGNAFVVVEGKLDRERSKCEMVEVGRRAVLSTSALGMRVVGDIHVVGAGVTWTKKRYMQMYGRKGWIAGGRVLVER